jgi:hypothetical protein
MDITSDKKAPNIVECRLKPTFTPRKNDTAEGRQNWIEITVSMEL